MSTWIKCFLDPLSIKKKNVLIDFREREEVGRGRDKERNIDIDQMFHLLIYSLVDSCMCPDWGSNL